MRLRFAQPIPAPTPPAAKLAPSGTWDGTAGSGYAGSPPTAQTRTTAKPIARLLNVHRMPFTADLTLVVDAEAVVIAGFGGVKQVNFYCEGNVVAVSATSTTFHNDVNGISKPWFGYACVLDWTTSQAAHNTGVMSLYMEAVPNNAALQNQLIGPFTFYPRLSGGIGPTFDCDIEIQIDKNAGSSSLPTMANSLTAGAFYLTAGQGGAAFLFPRLRCIRAGDHPFQTGVGGTAAARATWTTVTADLPMCVGDGSSNRTNAGLNYDGWRFVGSNVGIDLNKISPDGGGFRLPASTNHMLWFDGTDGPYFGANNFLLGSGSGAATLYDGSVMQVQWVSSSDSTANFELYYTDCAMHDLSQYGAGFCAGNRNCSVDTVSGTVFENIHGYLHNPTVIRADPALPTVKMRVFMNALSVYYSGPGTDVVTMNITGGLGVTSGKKCQAFVNGVQVGADLTLVGLLGAFPRTASNITQVAAVVTWFNGITNFNAVEITNGDSGAQQKRGAIYLTAPGQTSGATTGLAISNSSGSPTVIPTFIDAHAELLYWHTKAFSNVMVRRGASLADNLSHLSIAYDATVQDMAVCSFEAQSVADTYAGFAGYSAGFIMPPGCSHLIVKHFAESGGNESFQKGSGTGFTGDGYCSIGDHCAWGNLGWNAGVDPAASPNINIPGLVMMHQAAGLPTHSTNSVMLSSGVLSTDLFVDAANGNFTPKTSTILQLPDGALAGSRDLGGNWL